MGFSVRSHDWRYTVWVPAAVNKNDSSKPGLLADWAATATSARPRLDELYDHRGDDGTDYDWPGNDRNVASEPGNADVVGTMHRQARYFFAEAVPPARPKPPA